MSLGFPAHIADLHLGDEAIKFTPLHASNGLGRSPRCGSQHVGINGFTGRFSGPETHQDIRAHRGTTGYLTVGLPWPRPGQPPRFTHRGGGAAWLPRQAVRS
jgi:hypothetical protein